MIYYSRYTADLYKPNEGPFGRQGGKRGGGGDIKGKVFWYLLNIEKDIIHSPAL